MDLRALIFMPALACSIVFGFVFLLYLCGVYLHLVESTAAGAKEVPWEGVSIVDNFTKLVYLGFLIGVWLMPAIAVGRIVTGGMSSPWVNLIGPLLILWICYPISQLSSLSASTIWLPLVPDVLARLAQRPVVVLQFLLLSAGAMALLGIAFRWTFQIEGEWELLFVGVPLLVLAVFLYARLLGRLAFVLRFTKGLFPEKQKKKPKPPPARDEQADKPKKKLRQPRELAPLESPEGELSGYDVKFEDESAPLSRKRYTAGTVGAEPKPEPEAGPPLASAGDDHEDTTAYGVREPEVVPEEVIPEEVVKPSVLETRLLARPDAPKKPRRAWGPDLFAFLGQPGTISALLIASCMCFAVGVMVRVARANVPGSGDA